MGAGAAGLAADGLAGLAAAGAAAAGFAAGATGFDFDMPANVPTTKVPDAGTLGLLRGPIADKLREFYPDFADRVFPVPA